MHNNYTELDRESEASALSSPSPDCLAGPSPLSSALPSAVTDKSLFTHMNALVEEASDVVCSTGLEEGDVVVEDHSCDAGEESGLVSGTGCK